LSPSDGHTDAFQRWGGSADCAVNCGQNHVGRLSLSTATSPVKANALLSHHALKKKMRRSSLTYTGYPPNTVDVRRE